MLERLHKVLARAGVAALRPAEDMIMAGRVTVNGRVIRELGARVDPDTDVIAVDGQLVEMPQPSDPNRYVVLYKPTGVVSTAYDPQGRPTVVGLVPCDVRLFPVGRLDSDSEGLILLTNDGDLAYRLTHPRFEVEKEYRVLLDHTPKTEDLRRWREGIELEGQMTMPAWIEVLDRSADGTWVRVVMREGRNRQIREVARLLGYHVLRLIRVREGPLPLGDLTPGAWRELTPQEVQSLRAHTQHIPSRAADQERERRMADSDRPEGRRLRVIRGQRRPASDPAQAARDLAGLVAQAREDDEPSSSTQSAPPTAKPVVRRARVYQQPQSAAPQQERRADGVRPTSDDRPARPRAATSRPAPSRAPGGQQRGTGRQQNGYQQRDQGGYRQRDQGGAQQRDQSGGQQRDQGGFRQRDQGGGQQRDQGGFRQRDQGGYQQRRPYNSFDEQARRQPGAQDSRSDETGRRNRDVGGRAPRPGVGGPRGPQRSYGDRGPQRSPAPRGPEGRTERGSSMRDFQRSSPYSNRRNDQRPGPRNYDRRPGPPRTPQPSDDRYGRAYDNQRDPDNQRDLNERGPQGNYGTRSANGQRPAGRSPRDYADRGGFGGRPPRTNQGGGARNGFGGRPPQRRFEQGAGPDRRDRPPGSGTAPRPQGGFRQNDGPTRSNEYDRPSEGGYEGRRTGAPSSGPRRAPSTGRGGPSRGPSSGFNRSSGSRAPSRGPGAGRPTSGASRSGPNTGRPNTSRPNTSRPNTSRPNTGRPNTSRPSTANQRRPGAPRRRDDEE